MEEARFFKPPVVANMPTCGNTGIVIRKPDDVFYPLSTDVPNTIETPEHHPGVMALPREIRDEVYRYLLSNTYLVNLPHYPNDACSYKYYVNKDFEPFFGTPMHPQFQPPIHRQYSPPASKCGYTMAPWCTFSPGYEVYRRFLQEKKHQEAEARLRRQFNFENPYLCLPTLINSMITSAEASSLLYSTSTFFFYIHEAPRLDLFPGTIARTRNIYIHVNLLRAYLRVYSTVDQARTLDLTRRLIHLFHDDKITRASCIINFERTESSSWLDSPKLIAAFEGLTGFQTVVIRLTAAYKKSLVDDEDHIFSTQDWKARLWAWRKRDIENLLRQELALRKKLGISNVYVMKDFVCLVFHPRHHLNGGLVPKFDLKSLNEPPDPVTKAKKSAGKSKG